METVNKIDGVKSPDTQHVCVPCRPLQSPHQINAAIEVDTKHDHVISMHAAASFDCAMLVENDDEAAIVAELWIQT
jgi:hypothetical protein